MNEEINYPEHFYQQASRDTSVLEKNAGDYPYCSVAGFLLLYHYKKTGHPGFEKFSKKTALHFKNANWLHFLLDQSCNEIPEVVEIRNEEAMQASHDQNSGGEIEEVTPVNEVTAEESEVPSNSELNSLQPPAIPGEEIAQKEETASGRAVNTSAAEVAFEPLHTVDYFASQGIKITEEPAPTDKLGNQMKSFTAWLKSMKKLHPSKPEGQDLATETIIQNAAEESNINTEVLTEAMAEVLIKQDKKEKAIEMYNKLSLINPSKSVYFAAKIASIKSS